MTQSIMAMAVIAAALAAAIGLLAPSAGHAADGRRIVIEIRDFAFDPARPALHPGNVVVWKNSDIVPHTASAADGSWDSEEIAAGGEWETVVTADMAANYFCLYHPSMVASLEAATQTSSAARANRAVPNAP